MVKTAFDPRIDGFRYKHIWELQDSELVSISTNLQDARDRVSAEIRSTFYDASSVFGVHHYLDRLVDEEAILEQGRQFGLREGMIFTALDLYHHNRFPPGKLRVQGPFKDERFREYLFQRSLDSLGSNARNSIWTLAVSFMIPENWVPEDRIVGFVRREIGRHFVFEDVDIRLELTLPKAGTTVLESLTRACWARLRDRIDAGEPRPIRLIQNPAAFFDNKQVIAYGYEYLSQEEGSVYFYDVDCPRQALSLAFHLGQDTFTISSDQHGRPPAPIHGFLFDHYEPVRPPVSPLLERLQAMFPRQGLWKVRRFFRSW